MTKAEHPLEECIGMFHRRSDLRYPDISPYALNRKWMTSHRSIHRTICSPVFRAEISLVPVTYDSGRTEIYLRIMHIGRCYWKLLNDLDLNDKSMCLVAVMLLIILCRRWSILDLRVFASSSRGLPYSPLSASMRDGRVKIRVFPDPSTSNCTVSFPEYSYPACFTSGNMELLPYRIPDLRE